MILVKKAPKLSYYSFFFLNNEGKIRDVYYIIVNSRPPLWEPVNKFNKKNYRKMKTDTNHEGNFSTSVALNFLLGGVEDALLFSGSTCLESFPPNTI